MINEMERYRKHNLKNAVSFLPWHKVTHVRCRSGPRIEIEELGTHINKQLGIQKLKN